MWALPFLTALAPCERYCRERGRRHKRLTDHARQPLLQARRWLLGQAVVAVADSSFAAIDLLAALAPSLACVTRLRSRPWRLDTRLVAPRHLARPGRSVGRPRIKGERLPLLRDVLADAATTRTRMTVAGWYGEGAREVDLATGTGVWHHPGLLLVPLCWVLARDPLARDPLARFSPS